MNRLFLFLLFIYSMIFAYDCQDCKEDLAKCHDWADNAIKQGRVPKYCDPTRCDHICSEEDKKKRGIKTDAEKWADQRFDAEQNMRNNMYSYETSLNKEQQKVYNYVQSIINENLSKQQSICYQQNMDYMGYGMNENFMVSLCVVERIRNLTRDVNRAAFVTLMEQLKIPEQYWDVANMAINNVVGSLASSMY